LSPTPALWRIHSPHSSAGLLISLSVLQRVLGDRTLLFCLKVLRELGLFPEQHSNKSYLNIK
jgi:hypothetical protein